ncbi:trypsin Inhibitor like cysteine rich domain protein [Cooperia oncophora]
MHVPSVSVDLPVQTRIASTTTSTTSSTEGLRCAVNETVVECGRVCEADCVSIFTRSDCDECGSPACACMQGYARNPQGTCVYWGDCPVNGSAEATTTTPAPTTRKKIEKPTKTKVGGDVCYGDFRYPTGCSDCDYKLSWNYVEDSDDIEFSLETKLKQNSWTGLGLSKDGSMIGTHANGVLRAQFMRKRSTGDKNDKSFVDECWKMMFPVTGGKLDDSGNVTAHIETPLVTDKEVCIRSCREEKKSDG